MNKVDSPSLSQAKADQLCATKSWFKAIQSGGK
jgi:hypothetical protein